MGFTNVNLGSVPVEFVKPFFPNIGFCSISELSTIFFDVSLTFLKTQTEWSREISP